MTQTTSHRGLGVDPAFAAELYRTMRLIRRFEERVIELVNTNEIAGVTHEAMGQEAVAVGVCSALRPDDVITSTHRGHGHVIAKGAEVRKMIAELLGRESGCNRGRGGSMHIADFSLGVYGANGIVGAGTPMACGAAHVFKRRGTGQVAAPFFGDGAMNQGVVLETLNLAAIWTLPVVFVCENNGWAVTMPSEAASKLEPHQRAASYGMPSVAVDGNDVAAVYHATAEAVQRARSGGGPTFLECKTYRIAGHQTAERLLKMSYRTEAEIERWRQLDPIQTWGRRLLEAGTWTDADHSAADAWVEEQLEAGIAFARGSAWPDAADAWNEMYATPYAGIPARGTL